ncbi:MAG TPA: type III-B CRISPR module-associated Cmr3 family protein [Thermoanaerobaculia bacterium]
MSAEWQGYTLQQEDVWFFRDSKPSLLGADHYLRSIFPPLPSTLYGLVRTQRLLAHGADLDQVSESWWKALPDAVRKEVGDWGEDGSLQLRGPWMTRGDKILLPAPGDLRLFLRAEPPDDDAEEHDRIEAVLRLRPAENRGSGADWSHDLAPMSPFAFDGGRWTPWTTPRGRKDPQPSGGWFLELDGIREWISGGVPSPSHFVAAKQLWLDEPRTGLGLDSERRKHLEHLLFTFGCIRLCRGVALGFELRNGAVEDERILPFGQLARFGGESRLARIEKGPSLSEALRGAPHGEENHVIALLAPAIFGHGALPDGKVIAAVVPGALLAGGWDLANRRPKKLQRAAPAGSVYWIDGPAPALLSASGSMSKQGFGLMLAGAQPRRSHG